MPAAATQSVRCEGVVNRVSFFSAKLFFFDLVVLRAGYRPEDASDGETRLEGHPKDDEQTDGGDAQLGIPSEGSLLNLGLKSGARCGWRRDECVAREEVLTMPLLHKLTGDIRIGTRLAVTYTRATTEGSSTKAGTTSAPRTIIPSFVAILGHSGQGVPEVIAKPAPAHGVGRERVPSQAEALSKTKAHRAPKHGVCKFWVNSKRCPLEHCTQPHPTGDAWKEANRQWHTLRRERRLGEQRARAQRTGEHLGPVGAATGRDDRAGARKKRPKSERAHLLCDWLLEHVGRQRLCEGGGVIDIAGGRGDVAARLDRDGIPAVVVDPRVCLQRNGEPVPIRRQLQECFDDDFVVRHADLLRAASLLVGMHPDQATEPLVDYALQHRKPFVVVPCCVFVRELGGHRVIRDTGSAPSIPPPPPGEPPCNSTAGAKLVATYEEYLDFLQGKDRRIQRRFLNFRGRNAVLYLLSYEAGAEPRVTRV